MSVVIIDYGMGNIKSLMSAFRYVGVDNIAISSDEETLKKADKLVLPGVGSFSKAMKTIKEKKLDSYLHELVIKNKVPILGVCLGMQLMGLSSTEHGEHTGLGFVDGLVTKFNDTEVKVPHVGFNQVVVNEKSRIYHHMSGSVDFYFTHSYKMNSLKDINQSQCQYGDEFIASYEKDNIVGVQFHPELSQKNGLNIIKNFIEKF